MIFNMFISRCTIIIALHHKMVQVKEGSRMRTLCKTPRIHHIIYEFNQLNKIIRKKQNKKYTHTKNKQMYNTTM